MRLSIIVAMSRSGVIGRGGALPWRLSADLKRFKTLTMGHHTIMGRKTYDSLGRPLPGRTSVIVSRQEQYRPPLNATGVLVVPSLDEALALAAGDDEPFVIGGGEIFALALPRADRLYVTWIEAAIDGDTYFPTWDASRWRLVAAEPHAADARNEYDTTFCIYDRI
jgi:dihydrofolate reductase